MSYFAVYFCAWFEIFWIQFNKHCICVVVNVVNIANAQYKIIYISNPVNY